MDPEACLKAAKIALDDDDIDLFRELVEAYSAWRRKGGFEPILEIRGDAILGLLKTRCDSR